MIYHTKHARVKYIYTNTMHTIHISEITQKHPKFIINIYLKPLKNGLTKRENERVSYEIVALNATERYNKQKRTEF